MRNYLSTTLYYDANGSAAGVGGSGVWDHTSALWNTAADGSGNRVAWDGVSGVKSAVFGGVFGQVAIQSDVVVDSLSIQTPGYKIIGDHTLMFGSTGSITTAAGVDLRLSTKLSGSITISGDGVNAIILTRDVGRDNTNPSITVANGSLLRLSATQHLNALTLNAGAAARINQGGAKALVLNTLHIAGTLTTPTATLDVEDNAMIVTDANAAAQVFGWMVAGFGTGDWTGHGITSTIAANDPNGLLALGYANNIDLGASQFAGITLGNNDTIVKFTYYGDADLDGVVTLEDFSQFLYGYQQGGTPNWIDGDFDYSGTVTLEDFSLFLANHNTTPATPTYAIDGLDQTFTAGEEVTLSPRITNNIPLPAGTTFSWYVDGEEVSTSANGDYAFIPAVSKDYDVTLVTTSDGNSDVAASDTAYVGIPVGYHLVETVDVHGQGSYSYFNAPFETSGSYFFRASGTVIIAGGNTSSTSDDREGDAVSIQRASDHVWVANTTNLSVSNVTSWGPISSSHTYTSPIIQGNGSQASARFLDAQPGDNADKNMKVQMFKAATKEIHIHEAANPANEIPSKVVKVEGYVPANSKQVTFKVSVKSIAGGAGQHQKVSARLGKGPGVLNGDNSHAEDMDGNDFSLVTVTIAANHKKGDIIPILIESDGCNTVVVGVVIPD